MPIALGPFPHPSYDTTAGGFLNSSPSSSFPKRPGRELRCVSVLRFSHSKCMWPSMTKTFGKLLHQMVLLNCLPQVMSTLRCSPMSSLLQSQPCLATSRAPSRWVLSTYTHEQGRVLHLLAPTSSLAGSSWRQRASALWPNPDPASCRLVAAQCGLDSWLLGELWCCLVARQNKQTLENHLKTRLLEDRPRK